MPITLDASTQTALEANLTFNALFVKITRRDLLVIGLTDFNRPLTISGVLYSPSRPFIPSEISGTSDDKVGSMSIEGILDTVIKQVDLIHGIYDNAEVTVFLMDWRDVANEQIIVQKGWLGENASGSLQFSTEIFGLNKVLTAERGRVAMAECDADVGDVKCGVALGGFIGSDGTVTSVTDNGMFTCTIPDDASSANATSNAVEGYFTGGIVTWDTATLNVSNSVGLKRLIKYDQYTSGTTHIIHLAYDMPFNIATTIPDTFSIQPGCKKSRDDCQVKFSNYHNFRGMPYMPGNKVFLEVGRGA